MDIYKNVNIKDLNTISGSSHTYLFLSLFSFKLLFHIYLNELNTTLSDEYIQSATDIKFNEDDTECLFKNCSI